jgi:hypothetical protein
VSNKRVMIVKDDGLVEYTCEKSNSNDIPPLEDVSDLEFAEEALVIRRALLSVQVKEDDVEQKKNIFHTRCLVNNKVYNIIIDSGSCTNVTSIIMVKKLNMNSIKHERTYQL